MAEQVGRLIDTPGMTADEARTTAETRTRLNSFPPAEIVLLLRAGYAGGDALLRTRGLVVNDPAASFESLSTGEHPHSPLAVVVTVCLPAASNISPGAMS